MKNKRNKQKKEFKNKNFIDSIKFGLKYNGTINVKTNFRKLALNIVILITFAGSGDIDESKIGEFLINANQVTTSNYI